MNTDHFDIGTLRLSQAKGLTEALGLAVAHGGLEGGAEDAANGIVALLDQAHEAFNRHWEASK